MSSQARTAANKRNAARSTGPLSTAGKKRASCNARKHGLSISIRHDLGFSNQIEALAVALAGNNAAPRRLQAARGVAEAQLELRRLQEFKVSLIEVEATSIRVATKATDKGGHSDRNDVRAIQDIALAYLQALPALAILDRYERRALSRHRKAFQSFAIVDEE